MVDSRRAKVIPGGNGPTVQLPSEFELDCDEVLIERDSATGNLVLIPSATPRKRSTLASYFERVGYLDEDLGFMEERPLNTRIEMRNVFADVETYGDLWELVDQLIAMHEIVIDRPKASAHPRFPEFIYPVDYGFLKRTVGGDGDPIDIYVGTGNTRLRGYFRTRDDIKQDREIKLLWNVTNEELEAIGTFLYEANLHPVLVERPS